MRNKPLESYFPSIVREIKGFAIFMTDPNGTILTWNKGCEIMKGYKPDEVIGQNYRILFPDFLKEEGMPEKEIGLARENGRYETENWRRTKSGELFWAHVVLTKITDEDGELIGYVKITQDQSEKKKVADQLQSKIDDFKAINADLNSFAHTASHDLKAPINNIEGLALMIKAGIKKKLPDEKKLLTQIDLIHQSALKFKSIITDMAITAKEETEDYTYQTFKDVSYEIKSLLAQEIKSTGAVFVEEYAEARYIRYPRKHIRSILYNLITNALKYRSPERKPKISIKTSQVNGYTLLEVSDNGIGIKEEDQQRIFVMHQRLEESKNEEGTGIGLALVAKIVDGNRGKIEVTSMVNQGSTFKIYLK